MSIDYQAVRDKMERYKEPSALCTKCGWVGRKSDLRRFSPKIDTQCPNCDYLAMVLPQADSILALVSLVVQLTYAMEQGTCSSPALVMKLEALMDTLKELR